jgi:organic hydroperoxide reductase OsmC/OhrA
MPPAPIALLNQVERYRFEVRFAEPSWTPLVADLAPPTGSRAGPTPEEFLAAAMGQCLSSTLLFTLGKARVPVGPMRTRVWLTVGKNPNGRTRVQHIEVEIDVAPVQESDRDRFDRCVATFADYCTVSGAVREGIPTDVKVGAGPA